MKFSEILNFVNILLWNYYEIIVSNKICYKFQEKIIFYYETNMKYLFSNKIADTL